MDQSLATLSQTFDTAAGFVYTVSCFVTAQQVGTGEQSYLAQALNGATVLGSRSDPIPAVAAWVNRFFDFIASSTSSTLRFTDTSRSQSPPVQ